jgi:hypothetical protein
MEWSTVFGLLIVMTIITMMFFAWIIYKISKWASDGVGTLQKNDEQRRAIATMSVEEAFNRISLATTPEEKKAAAELYQAVLKRETDREEALRKAGVAPAAKDAQEAAARETQVAQVTEAKTAATTVPAEPAAVVADATAVPAK